MNYWVVERAAAHSGDSGVLMGVAKDGRPTYVYKRGDEMRFADERSALGFVRVCEDQHPPRYDNMADHYDVVHVVNG